MVSLLRLAAPTIYQPFPRASTRAAWGRSLQALGVSAENEPSLPQGDRRTGMETFTRQRRGKGADGKPGSSTASERIIPIREISPVALMHVEQRPNGVGAHALDHADDGHLHAAVEPAPGGHDRLGSPNREVRGDADARGGKHGG